VYAEAGGGFVDVLCKLLFAPYHELIDFAGPEPPGGFPDEGSPGARASRLPLSTLKDRCVGNRT